MSLPARSLLRTQREKKGLSMRALARRIGVSPSLVSQVETGKVSPSVGTLVSITAELGLSLDELFADPPPPAPRSRHSRGDTAVAESPVMRLGERPALELENGVTWYRLTPHSEEDVDFLYVVYDVGGESCPPDAMMVHRGREYGLVIAGRIGAKIGFETSELAAGDSIVFEARSPHRFWTVGDRPAVVVWSIIGRAGETRNAFGDA